VSVKRTVREHVTVQDNSWIPLAVVAVVAAAAAAGGFLVFRRRRRKEEEAPEAVAAAEEAPPREPESGPKVRLPPPVAGLSDDQKKVRKQAQKAIDSTEDRVADFLEGTPPPGVDITLAMESLELARDFMKEGDYPEALVYAKEAETAVTPAPRAAEAPGEPEEPEKPDVGKLACPGCGEKLDPDWPICPICGHQTR